MRISARVVCFRALCGLLILLQHGWPNASRAQEEITPPVLRGFVEAEYPQSAARDGLSAVVEFSVTIDASGQVAEAEVVERQGHGFDEAALAALMQFRFSPATREGEPIAVRIRYRYRFELRERTEEPNLVHPVEADDTPDLAPPEVSATAESSTRSRGQTLTEPTYGAVAEVSALALDTDVLTRSVEGPMLTRIPGTRGDPLRAVEILPGVGRPSFIDGGLLVRGAAPGDTQTFFEGMPIPLAFHFGGLTSFAPAPFIERIDFYPGNFSVRYGRRMGGVLDVVAHDPQRVLQGAAELSLIDVRAHAQFPVGRHAAAQVGVRRSIMDLTVAPFVREFGVGIVRFPIYYDWQGLLTWKPTTKDRIRVLAYGSSDRFEIEDPSRRLDSSAGIDFMTRFSLFHVGWEHRFDERTEVEFDLQYGLVRYDVGASTSLTALLHQVHGRAELTHRATQHVSLGAGVDVSVTPFRFHFSGETLRQREGATPEAMGTSGRVSADQEWTTANRPAAFIESTFDFPVVRVTLGLRTDYDSLIRRWNLDPRMNVALRMGPGWQMRGGVGLFSQPPELEESSPVLGNPDLDWVHSMHSSLGLQYQPSEGNLRVSLDGFYKHLWDRVVAPTRGVFSNGGLGRIYGAELGAHLRPTTSLPLFAQLSYTLMRSERQDTLNDPWRSSDVDQTHIFSLTLSYELPRGWKVGAGMRVVSGNPYTAANGAVFNVNRRNTIPIVGPTNGERHPLFHRLDLRVEKNWSFAAWRLSLFLDIQNVYNQANQELIQNSPDYRRTVPINGLPILPSIGLRGEL